MANTQTIITCEHASPRLPQKYIHLFQQDEMLQSHQAWDIGAKGVAEEISKALSAPLFLGEYSRLLIDLNRSVSHPSLFSASIKALSPAERQNIITEYYSPYRNRVVHEMNQVLERGDSLQHISVHSFTPVMQGVRRDCDVGILYDPNRIIEKHFAMQWQQRLRAQGLNVRLNYPYRGTTDGFVTYLRKVNPPTRYIGIELEINQALFDAEGHPFGKIAEQIIRSL
ncbi:MAG: N-formylglutamate amidohydrolase [Pseudomonadota bacterium]|nr:N-formylglutamate amidohydrolase [Pseudomonadota bacterium]